MDTMLASEHFGFKATLPGAYVISPEAYNPSGLSSGISFVSGPDSGEPGDGVVVTPVPPPDPDPGASLEEPPQTSTNEQVAASMTVIASTATTSPVSNSSAIENAAISKASLSDLQIHNLIAGMASFSAQAVAGATQLMTETTPDIMLAVH